VAPRIVLLLLGWLGGWWLLWRIPTIGRASGRPTVSPVPRQGPALADCAIVVPARNEELSLPNLLASISEQTVRPAEVLVVDDQSTDATRAIAEAHPGVTVVTGVAPPPGWTGKTWACEQGLDLTTSPHLLFVDADVTLAPTAVESVLAVSRERGGLVSVQPYHRMVKAYERFSALFNVIAFMGTGAASPRRDGRSVGAFGPVLCCERSELEAVGTFEAVRGEIVEDMALARRFSDQGRPVHAFGGGELASFRMYPGGLGSLVEGWSKNFATGAATAALGRVAVVFLWITALLTSVQLLIEVAVGGSTVPVAVLAVVYAAFALQLRVMLGQMGDFGSLTAALYPALAGIFLAVFARSVWLTAVRRKVRWRGRDIPLSKRARWAATPARPE
jgi:4,4'-diaponeurosporenoate glycosyltransferase